MVEIPDISEYGLAVWRWIPVREPEFIDGDIDLRINIYRGQIGESVTNVTKNVTEIITKDKIPEEIDEIFRKIKASRDCEQEQCGLKAARRAPQFSKR